MTQAAVPPGQFQGGSCWGADGVYYPAEEERTVPLSGIALRLILYLYTALNYVFAARSDVYVGADQLFYWSPDDLGKSVAPDGYVIFGIPKLPIRSVIRVWEEASPAFVIEVSNAGCRADDRGR